MTKQCALNAEMANLEQNRAQMQQHAAKEAASVAEAKRAQEVDLEARFSRMMAEQQNAMQAQMKAAIDQMLNMIENERKIANETIAAERRAAADRERAAAEAAADRDEMLKVQLEALQNAVSPPPHTMTLPPGFEEARTFHQYGSSGEIQIGQTFQN